MMRTFLLILLLSISISPLLAEDIDYDNPEARKNLEREILINPNTGKIPQNIRAKELEFSNSLPKKDLFSIKDGIKLQNNIWTNIGPNNIGGRTRAIVVDKRYNGNTNKVILAGAVSGGVYKSVDGGNSWFLTSTGIHDKSVTSIIQDPRDGYEDHWYYSCGEAPYNSASGGSHWDAFHTGIGIFKSTDNGSTWEVLPGSIDDNFQRMDALTSTYKLQIDPSITDETHLYVACYGGIYRTINDGNSFELVLGAEPYNNTSKWPVTCDITILANGIKYASLSKKSHYSNFPIYDNNGIFRSENGENWVEISPEDNFPQYILKTVSCSVPGDEEKVLFLIADKDEGLILPEDQYSFANVYMYEHKNATWTSFNEKINLKLDLQSHYNMLIAVKPDDPNTVFIGGTDLLRTIDFFETEENIKRIGGYDESKDIMLFKGFYANHHPDQHGMAFLPNDNNVMLSAHDGGISKTLDCKADSVFWSWANNGYQSAQFYTVGISKNIPNMNIVIGGLQDNGVIAYPGFGKDWSLAATGDGSSSFFSNDMKYLYGSVQYGYIARVEFDQNLNIINPWAITGFDSEKFSFINHFILDPDENDVIYINGRREVYFIENTTTMDSTFPLNTILTYKEAAVSSFQTGMGYSNNTLYVGGLSNSKAPKIIKISKLHEREFNFEDISSSIFPKYGYLQCIEVDPNDPKKVIVVFSNYGIKSIFYTEDGGENWESISGNLEENPNGSGNGPSCRWAEIVRPGGGAPTYFVATSVGLFSTQYLDGDNTVWTQEGADVIGNNVVTMVNGRDIDGFVAVATHGHGAFTTNIPVGVEDNKKLSFYLSSPQPNPVQNEARIYYSLENEGIANISIYDIKGMKVLDFTDQYHAKGLKEFSFNTSSLSSGTYYINLNIDRSARTVVMKVVK